MTVLEQVHPVSTPPVTGDALARVLAAVRALYQSDSRLREFVAWPMDLAPGGLAPRDIPVCGVLQEAHLNACPETQGLTRAVQAAAFGPHWHRTYTEAEVGADFLNRFGYYNLIGPRAQWCSATCYASIAYWGAGLRYDWHDHPAEEMYVILAGQAEFFAEGEDDLTLTPGMTRIHRPWQRHAMTTTDHPLLALVFWRGAGLDALPTMSRT